MKCGFGSVEWKPTTSRISLNNFTACISDYLYQLLVSQIPGKLKPCQLFVMTLFACGVDLYQKFLWLSCCVSVKCALSVLTECLLYWTGGSGRAASGHSSQRLSSHGRHFITIVCVCVFAGRYEFDCSSLLFPSVTFLFFTFEVPASVALYLVEKALTARKPRGSDDEKTQEKKSGKVL